MSLTSSLFSGVSGLDTLGSSMSVIGDNIANVNTVGFKASRATFQDVLLQSVSTAAGTAQVGGGTSLADISISFAQGSFESTDSSTDLAIGGEGFFVVRDPNNQDMKYYTRAGDFSFDKNNNLVNPNGLVVQGYEVGIDGSLGSISDIIVSSQGSPPNPTTEMNTTINLNADAEEWDEVEETGGKYSTSITVYDSLGNDVTLTIDFTKAESGWDWAASVPENVGECSSTGSLAFDETGALTTGTEATIDITSLSSEANDMEIIWNFLDESGESNGSITSYASDSTTAFLSQNGYAAGTLQGIIVDEDGFVIGQYSNGEVTSLYQIALAKFQNTQGLDRAGGNLYRKTGISGDPIMGKAGSSGLGTISPNSLEQSNVDIANEFVKMITTQRGFQANSKIITVADQMLSELINLKRY